MSVHCGGGSFSRRGGCLRVGSLVETVQYPLTACVRVVSFIHRLGSCFSPAAPRALTRSAAWGTRSLSSGSLR